MWFYDSAPQDAFCALGLPSQASLSEVKSAYRKLMRELHPDTQSASDLSAELEERFLEVQEAYRELRTYFDTLPKAA